MKLHERFTYFKKKSFQVSLIVVTTTMGTLSSLIFLLLKDESVFLFNHQLYNMCLKLLPFWFIVNIMIAVTLLTHITFRSYAELVLFEIGCIIVDQVFHTILFTSRLLECKQTKPFLHFYYMYGDSYFEVKQRFRYQNSSVLISNYEPCSTRNTNPYIFKWHRHYNGSDFACQVPYSRFLPNLVCHNT